MMEHLSKNLKENSRFNIYVDLFSKGEFSEMNIEKDANGYQVRLGETYMGTLSCKDNDWKVVEGSIPSFIIPDIARNIKGHN